jgi:O-antigen ligase
MYWLGVLVLAPILLIPLEGWLWLAWLAVPLAALGLFGGHRKRSPFTLPILLLMGMALVSTQFSYDLRVSLPKLCGLLLGLLVFWGLHWFTTGRRIYRFTLFGFLLLGSGMSLVSLFFTNWPTVKFGFLNRVTALIPSINGLGQLINPNEVAGTLLWLIPLSLMLLLSSFSFVSANAVWRAATKLFLLLVLLLFIVTFVLVQSRAAYLILFITLGGLVVLWFFTSVKARAGWLTAGALVLLSAALVLVFNQKVVAFAVELRSYIPDQNSLALRPKIWSSAIYMIKDAPLTGMGMNTYRTMVHYVNPLTSASAQKDFGHAHNEFLQAALDLGLPGALALVSIYLVAFYLLARCFAYSLKSKTHGLPVKALVLGLGGGLLAHALWGMVDAIALGAKPGFLFWMLLGLISALYNLVFDAQDAESGVGHAR